MLGQRDWNFMRCLIGKSKNSKVYKWDTFKNSEKSCIWDCLSLIWLHQLYKVKSKREVKTNYKINTTIKEEKKTLNCSLKLCSWSNFYVVQNTIKFEGNAIKQNKSVMHNSHIPYCNMLNLTQLFLKNKVKLDIMSRNIIKTPKYDQIMYKLHLS